MRGMKAKELRATIDGVSGVKREREFYLQGYRKALGQVRNRAVKFDLHGKGTEMVPALEVDYLDLEAQKCER